MILIHMCIHIKIFMSGKRITAFKDEAFSIMDIVAVFVK